MVQTVHHVMQKFKKMGNLWGYVLQSNFAILLIHDFFSDAVMDFVLLARSNLFYKLLSFTGMVNYGNISARTVRTAISKWTAAIYTFGV